MSNNASNWWSIAPMSSGGEHHYDIHHVYRCRGAYVQRRTVQIHSSRAMLTSASGPPRSGGSCDGHEF